MIRSRAPLLTLAALILIVAGLILLVRRNLEQNRRVADPPAIVTEIQRLNDLISVKYSVQKIVGLREQKFPLGEESILLIVQARVLGGVDLSRLKAEHIKIGPNRAIYIQLPDAQILHVYLDDKETKVWDRSVTWWTPWVPFNPDLERKARLEAIESVKKAALDMGILDEAKRNAQSTIRGLLQALGGEAVVFQPPS